MMRRIGAWVLLGAAAVSTIDAARAQGRELPPGVRERVRRQIEEMRRAMRLGKVVRTNVRVRVRLRNGNKIKGVVRNGRFVERIHGLDFVPADMKAEGAGVRVWYYDNTTSYIFLPFREILSYTIGERLTDDEVKAIEKRIERESRIARQRREEQLAKRRANAEGEARGAKEEDLAKEAERTAEQRKKEDALLKLLDEFPPDEGWGEKRVRAIQMRKITVGAFPDARSRRFLEVFPDWRKALEIRKRRDAEAAEVAEEKRGLEGGGSERESESSTPPQPAKRQSRSATPPATPPKGGKG